jgi:hypothetical protein
VAKQPNTPDNVPNPDTDGAARAQQDQQRQAEQQAAAAQQRAAFSPAAQPEPFAFVAPKAADGPPPAHEETLGAIQGAPKPLADHYAETGRTPAGPERDRLVEQANRTATNEAQAPPPVDNLTATITALLNLQGTLNRSFGDAVPDNINYRPSTSYTLGTGAKQLSTFYRAARTLAASANEDLDLSGVLADDLGTTIAFTKVKILFIENTSAVDTLSVGGAASNQWAAPFADVSDKLKIPPKSWYLFCSATTPRAGRCRGHRRFAPRRQQRRREHHLQHPDCGELIARGRTRLRFSRGRRGVGVAGGERGRYRRIVTHRQPAEVEHPRRLAERFVRRRAPADFPLVKIPR